MDRPEVDLELVHSLADFRQALRGFLAASEGISRAVGVTAVQYQAMLAICAWEGPMSVGDLAEQLILTHSAAVQMVQKLAAAGWVRRAVDEEDRRVVRVELTPEGGRLLKRLSEAHRDALLAGAPRIRASLRRLRNASRAQAGGERRTRR